MNCDECQELLQRRLDGAPPRDRTALDQHLGACPECRGLHTAAGRLEEGLRLFTVAPPLHFLDAVVGEVLADQRQLRRARRLRWSAVALAASLLVAVVLGRSLWSPNASPDIAKDSLPPTAPTAKNDAPKDPVADLSPIDLVARSGSAVTSLPRRVAEESAVTKWSLPRDVLPELPDVNTDTEGPALEKASQSLSEARQGMTVAWEAVESPMRRATSAWSRLTPSLQKQ